MSEQIQLSDKARAELSSMGYTTEDRGFHLACGYFCTECWAHEDELNVYDRCKSCAEGECVPVWDALL